jgi:general secretion pathway protein J
MKTTLDTQNYPVGAAPWPRIAGQNRTCVIRGQGGAPTGASKQQRGMPAAGFTLLELLVAVAIFALIGAMAYGGLQSVMDQQFVTSQQSQRLADLQKVYRIMQRDLEQLVNRRIRNEFGDSVDALVGGSGFDGVEFSRAGHPNPAGFLRSEIVRVAYIPDQDTLLRRTWRVLDRAQDSRPDEQLLVEDMRAFSIRFLDQEDEWADRWPPLQSEQAAGGVDFPRAVEVQLELDDIGILNWIFSLPQAFVAGVQPAGGTPAGNQDQDEAESGEEGGSQEEGESGEAEG